MIVRFLKLVKRSAHLWALLFFGFLLLGCGNQGLQPYHFTRFSMDTVIDFTIYAPGHDSARTWMRAAHQEIERIANLLWEENPASEIYRFNHSERGIETSREVYEFIDRARQYYWREVELSLSRQDGSFDITIYPVLQLYDFQAKNPVPPSETEINKHLQWVGMNQLKFQSEKSSGWYMVRKPHAEVGVAVGGMAKGYAVDRAIEVLRRRGAPAALVNAGGDLYCYGYKQGKKWKVGIQHPGEQGELAEILEVTGVAVATSGNYQRYYFYEGERYHHILNPKSGQPVAASQSATVIAPTTEEADVWATVLFIRGAVEGIRLLDQLSDVHGMVIDSIGVPHYSKGCQEFLVAE